MFNSLSINIPLAEALMEMARYARFMKELVTNKRTLECETIEVSYKCNMILTNHLVVKMDDPDAFSILCTIRARKFGKALCDLSAKINLIPLVIFKELGLELLH